MRISDEDLTNMVFIIADERHLFSCFSQAVKRCIKLITEAIADFVSEARDRFIKARIKSKEVLPQFETNKQFFKVLDKYVYFRTDLVNIVHSWLTYFPIPNETFRIFKLF